MKDEWNLLRACFWLLAIVVSVSMIETLMAVSGCIWMVVITAREPVGTCQQIGDAIRSTLDQLLTAILALIVAKRPPQQ